MNKIYKTIPYIISAAALFVVGTHTAFGVEYAPLTTIPGVLKAGQATNPVTVIKGIYGLAIGVGSVIAVVMIIIAGFKYMYEESITGKSGAKEQIENAFLGLLVILGSYILLRTINADLVNFNPQLPGGTGNIQGLIAADMANDAAVKQAKAAYDAQMASTVAPAQTSLANASSTLATINKSINDIQASTTISAADKQTQINSLQAAKTTAETNLATAAATAVAARNTAENARLTAVNQNALFQLQTALKNGDSAGAQGVLDRATAVYNTEIARRGGTDPSLQALQGTLYVQANQTIVDVTQTNIIDKMINRTDGYVPDYKQISDSRTSLITNTTKAILAIRASDPAAAATLTTKMNTAVAAIDAATATKLGCKSYDTTTTGIRCKD